MDTVLEFVASYSDIMCDLTGLGVSTTVSFYLL